MGPVSFRSEFPDGWHLYPVFHTSYLKLAVGYFGDSGPDSGICPVDDASEFEVEHVLDHCRVRRGHMWADEYVIKWVGYGLFEAT